MDGLPVSRIKVRIPFRRRELISRTRLIDSIYDQLEKRLLYVVAPAGYGKTSLLVDFAQNNELAVCWLSLDMLDQEPQRFLRYLIAAISEKFPNFGLDSLAALEGMTSFEQDEEQLLITITNEIAAQVHEHFILILDDYHLVGDIPIIGHLISRFLQLVGENVHLIIVARNLPVLPDTPLLIARNQIGGLTFEDLCFHAYEIQELFQQNEKKSLSLQDAESLVEETEGWIAAIHLTKGHPGTLPQMHPLQSTRELFDFFSREVLLRQPESARRFMLMTSVFDAFDVSLCREVLDPLAEAEHFDWQALFVLVQTANLFTVTFDDEGHWMRYHHLFQHFLRSKLHFDNPVLEWHIQQNLARAYEKRHSWEEALQVYASLDDHENLVRLLVHVGLIFILSGRILTLASWLKKLPSELLYSRPALISLLGTTVHVTTGDSRQALELFNLAESKLRDTEDKTEWTLVLIRRAEVYRHIGHFERALADIEQTLRLTDGSQVPSMQNTFAEAQRLKGLALFGLGQTADALVWLQAALHTCQTLGIRTTIPILETELGVMYRRLGEPEIAARHYASALEAWENAGNTGWKARLFNNLALLYHMTGRLDDAFPLLEKALYTAEQSGYVRIQTNILISLGDLLTDLGDLDAAYEHYDRALTLATHLGNSLLIFYASLGQARLQRLRGRTLLAIDDLKRVEISQVNMGMYERAIYNLELGCCLLESARFDGAIEVLGDAVRLLEQGGNQMERTAAQLWLAVASSVKHPDTAITQLREILPSQREWQGPTPFMINAGRAGKWVKQKESDLLMDPILRLFFEQTEKIAESLAALRNQLKLVSDRLNTASPRLEIVSFGDVQVYVNGQPIGLSNWQTREARDLFFFLLQSPPMTKEQIALEFWPDISPARLKMRFKINIYRIRQALGPDAVLFEGERYHFNRSLNYTWDRERFDESLREAQDLPASPEKIRLLEKAIALGKGAYLADVSGEWVVSERLKYHDICQHIMLQLSEVYLKQGHIQACVSTARLILNSDPLLEAAHRLLIQAYAVLHDPAGMTRQYQQYQQALEDEMGLQPSSEISDLYHQLLRAI